MKILSFDLGTGGVKASLHDHALATLSTTFFEYPTYYPEARFHEQKPDDWWEGVCKSTKSLLEQSGTDASEVEVIALSGHSLVVIPLDARGRCLLDQVPIWSDTRSEEEVSDFFEKIDPDDWYRTTGNGFPPACYSIFKLAWYKKHQPEIFDKTCKVLGSKDYINYLMTGNILTDYSYASGTGAYDLAQGRMRDDYLKAAGIPKNYFPDIAPSHARVGVLTHESAKNLGLRAGTLVACGGVDNSCMALGAIGTETGKAYVSLGSSSRIAVNSQKPILDIIKKPYVFAHIDESIYTSEFSIFAGGSSLRWIRDNICQDFKGKDAYDRMSKLARTSPLGARGILFNPSLAGGTSQDKSRLINGAFIGLTLRNNRDDLIRAAMEGIALNLRTSLDLLKKHIDLGQQILFSGGGSKNNFWMQIFADVFNMDIIKTNIDQDAASLGAAAIAAKAIGIWKNYDQIENLHQIQHVFKPDKENVDAYSERHRVFAHASDMLSDFADWQAGHNLEGA